MRVYARPVTARIVTWNLQGREQPDVEAVAAEVLAGPADVVLLQEIQRRQARALARALGGWSVTWRFKHWPVVYRAEGLAILTPTPHTEVRRIVLAHRGAFWSWKRRIAVAATVSGPAGPLRVVDTHLGAGVGDVERARQAALVADLAAGPTAGPDDRSLVAGDMNTAPGSVVTDVFVGAGLRDAWAEARPGDDGHTNWEPGPRTEPPVQRLDYVFVGGGLSIVDAGVPAFGSPGFERYGAISDHLPLTVTVEPRHDA